MAAATPGQFAEHSTTTKPTADYLAGRKQIDDLKKHIGDLTVDMQNCHDAAEKHLEQIHELGKTAHAVRWAKHANSGRVA